MEELIIYIFGPNFKIVGNYLPSQLGDTLD